MGTVCPQGHDSASSDFCDVCGTRISSSPSRPDGMTGKHHAPGRFVASGERELPALRGGRDRPVLRGVRIPGFRPAALCPSRASGGALIPLPPPKRARCHRPARRRPARHRPARPNRCSRRCPGLSRPFRLGAGRSRRLSRPARRASTAPVGQAVGVPEAPESPDEPTVVVPFESVFTPAPEPAAASPASRSEPSTAPSPRRPCLRRRSGPRRQPGLSRRPGPAVRPRPRRPRPQPRRRRPYPPFPASPGPCWLPRIASTTTG